MFTSSFFSHDLVLETLLFMNEEISLDKIGRHTYNSLLINYRNPLNNTNEVTVYSLCHKRCSGKDLSIKLLSRKLTH